MPSSDLAPAKVNLALHVTGQRDDGYHLLDTLVGFFSIGDRVHVEPADETGLTITGPYADAVPSGEDNLVLRALRAAQAVTSGEHAVSLEKNLPAASGIGGGSADAAAVLRAMATLHPHFDPQPLAAPLGADVPMCLAAHPLRARGIGDEIEAVALPQLYAVLANPGGAVSTPHVFAALDHRDNAPLDPPPAEPDADEWLMWLSDQRNDLQPPAFKLEPDIARCLDALWATSRVRLARMSGSGATCFALYDSERDAARAAAQLRDAHPDWWCVAGHIEGHLEGAGA